MIRLSRDPHGLASNAPARSEDAARPAGETPALLFATLVACALTTLLPLSASADLLDVPWKAVPAAGVEMTLAQTDAIRIDFDFHGRAGYAIARRDGRIELPESFELSFRIKGDAPRNTLEVKFVQGDNVWWTTRREYDFPRDWRRVSIKKRQLEFAWGPAGPSPLARTIDAIEIVVTAGTGGKGTVWLDDLAITPLEIAPGPPPQLPFPASGTLDLGARYEIGGVVLDWQRGPRPFELATSLDGKEWETRTFDAATWVPLPDTDARYIRVLNAKGMRVLPPMRDDNAFFAEMAKASPRGFFPRYLLGEQSYWTILGGTNGEEEEALFSEDGVIEAGNARFSIEPFLKLDGKPVSWNDVAIEQHEGPQVVWKKHLTITPRYENGTLKVRYQAAPNARLVLAIRPFQVNPQWQFLNRTGGVVRIKSITRQGDEIIVDADESKAIRFPRLAVGGWRLAADSSGMLPESQVAGDYRSLLLEFDDRDVTLELPLGEALSTQHSAPSTQHSAPSTQHSAPSTFSLHLPAEPRIAQTLEAQLRYILINKDGPAIHPGSRSYERSWIRDGSLTSEALLRLGQDQVVREFIEWYAKAIREDGYVPCCVSMAGADPVPEHDSHGQFIYLVAEYYRHTGDRALVEKMWPAIERIVAFIDKLRHERMTKQYEGTAFYGLVPESISHEGYSAKAMHSYWDDLFILKGLEDAAFLEKSLAGSRSAQGAGPFSTEPAPNRRRQTWELEESMSSRAVDSVGAEPEGRNMGAVSVERWALAHRALATRVPKPREALGTRVPRAAAAEGKCLARAGWAQAHRSTGFRCSPSSGFLAASNEARDWRPAHPGPSLDARDDSNFIATRRTGGEGENLSTLHAEFRSHLLASIERTMKQHDIAYMPGSVELGDFDATSTTVAVTPVDAELPAEALRNTFERYWQHALEPRTYTPYELRVAGTLVRLGQPERARQLLRYFFEDQRPAAWSQWAEVVRANPREGGFIGDMPHTWVGSDFIRSALDFLAYEDNHALILGAGLSREWAERGMRLRGLSTHYGTLDYSIEPRADGLRMRIGGDLRIPRNGIVVKSPYGMADVVIRSIPAELLLKSPLPPKSPTDN